MKQYLSFRQCWILGVATAAIGGGASVGQAWQQPTMVAVLEALRQTPQEVPFSTFAGSQQLGFDYESNASREMELVMGRAYANAVVHREQDKWARHACAGNPDNPFCVVLDGDALNDETNLPEILNDSPKSHISLHKVAVSTLRGGYEIEDSILEGRWLELKDANETEFYRAFLKMGNVRRGRKINAGARAASSLAAGSQFWVDHAQGWLSDTRVPASFFVALGSRLEEFLPGSATEETMLKCYERAYDMNRAGTWTESGAKAGFRAALFHISRHEYAQADALLKPMADIAAIKNFDSRLKFWRMYLTHQLNRHDEEAVIRKEMDAQFPLSFHGLVASRTQVADRFLSRERPDLQLQFRSQVVPELNQPLLAAEILIKLNAPPATIRPFIKRVADLAAGSEAPVKIYISVLLNRLGENLEKFRLMSQLFHQDPTMISAQSLELFFPLWHFPAIHQFGRLHELDPFLVIAIMRQESAFNEHARSPAGALGLLQMMPQTALRLAHVRAKDLLKADVNIGVGTQFFSNLMARFNSHPVEALAAYNAGPMKVVEWMKRYPTVDSALLFTDLIPYRETREYVAAIMRNYYWYARLYSDDWKSVLKPFKIWDEDPIATDLVTEAP